MFQKIATTRSLRSAWDLIERLKKRCVMRDFVIVLRSEGANPEVHPLLGFHPEDQKEARLVVQAMVTEASGRETSDFSQKISFNSMVEAEAFVKGVSMANASRVTTHGIVRGKDFVVTICGTD